jgi:hypothetical protein
MRDHSQSPESGNVALAFQALLYASGEMDGAEAVAFEARLGEDQAAREALCQAVQLSSAQAGPGTLRPDPAYRERLRKRFQPQRTFWRWFSARRPYRGHPLAWSGLGAVASFLLFLGVAQGIPQDSVQPGRVDNRGEPADRSATNQPAPSQPAKKQELPIRPQPSEPATSTAEAKVWAQLQTDMPWRKRIFGALKH